MFGLTPLGIIHTLTSLVAVAAGILAFVRYGRITMGQRAGQVYVWATVLTCFTGFCIFQHGGFGKAHMLGILTLLVMGVALVAERTRLFRRVSPYIETVAYSLTFFFHMVPGITETSTRLPPGAPWVANAETPILQTAAAAMFAVFLAGAAWQVRRLRMEHRA